MLSEQLSLITTGRIVWIVGPYLTKVAVPVFLVSFCWELQINQQPMTSASLRANNKIGSCHYGGGR